MPLSATVDDELVCGPLMDDGAWSRLRGRSILLQPCGHPAFPRVSRLGTRHFVHERDCGSHAPESQEHLHLKALVARAVAQAGWSAATEVPGEGFIADVMGIRDGARVAFEVQKSRQVLREYERRQATYAAAGVRAVWLVAKVPPGYQAAEHLPLFTVTDWLADPRVIVTGRTIAVNRLVGQLLAGSCRWRDVVPSTGAAVETMRLLCPMCGDLREVGVSRWLRGTCECGLPVIRQMRSGDDEYRRTCCGYWGPAIALGRRTAGRTAGDPITAGHWCLSA